MSSPQERFNNLVKVRDIKEEAPDQGEFDAFLASAADWLQDAQNAGNSKTGRFILAYDAAHALALAALRWQGYRPDTKKRYLVFQLLDVTASLPVSKGRFLYDCHEKRNGATYEAEFVADEPRIRELIATTKELRIAVEALGPVRT